MFARYLILSVILAAFMSGAALADGGFYGTVKYSRCDCNPGSDLVYIYSYATGDTSTCETDCFPCCGYNTELYGCNYQTFPPGSYKLWAVSEGCQGYIQYVIHSIGDQEVNLKVDGPAETPD